MPLPSIGENAVNGILYHRHFLLTPLDMVEKRCFVPFAHMSSKSLQKSQIRPIIGKLKRPDRRRATKVLCSLSG